MPTYDRRTDRVQRAFVVWFDAQCRKVNKGEREPIKFDGFDFEAWVQDYKAIQGFTDAEINRPDPSQTYSQPSEHTAAENEDPDLSEADSQTGTPAAETDYPDPSQSDPQSPEQFTAADPSESPIASQEVRLSFSSHSILPFDCFMGSWQGLLHPFFRTVEPKMLTELL